MATIAEQLRTLKKQINIPYAIRFVDHFIEEKDYEYRVIYIHIMI